MNDLLAQDVVARLVGVIDLLDGRAVHAIAGDRDHYRPVAIGGGDPIALANHYVDLGVSALYVADLDSLADSGIQLSTIDSLCRAAQVSEILIDIGWTGEESNVVRADIATLAKTHPAIAWIAATESCRSTAAVMELAGLVSPERVLLGLDYRSGRFIASDQAEDAWIDVASKLECRGSVILDLASVGTSCGPATIDSCKRVRQRAPSWSIYSGGGIRTADDVQRLIEAGCDRCLVATALHQ